MPSQRFNQMAKELTRLRRTLLPSRLSSQTFQPSERTSVRALSYRLLAHAEFESYVEDMARAIAEKARVSWAGQQKVSIVTLSMLSFSTLPLKGTPVSLAAPSNKSQAEWDKLLDCSENLRKAFSSFRHFVDQKNHGIKEENLLALLMPVGLSQQKLDPLFLAEINDFAKKRGNIAHSSVAGQIQVGINPNDEVQQAQRIRDGLKALDRELTDLLQRA